MIPSPSFCPRRSATGALPLSHDERALDAAVRRFPCLLRTCRLGIWPLNGTVRPAVPAIIAEYRRIVGKEKS
jgi:hypothetical protein